MARATKKQKAEALEWLQREDPPLVDETLAHTFAARFPLLSANVLRALLRTSGLALTPLVEGVRQDNFAELERTLLALATEYIAGPALRQREIRRQVISARQHADWAARNPKVSAPRRDTKTEMALWLRTWLENPAVFDVWVRLRKRTCSGLVDAM
jgi:hypothetical protein